jgi:MFS family permease
LYALGYVIVASSNGIEVFIAGIVVQSAGSTGLQVLQAIIVADTTSPQYRGLVLAIINIPYLINFAIAGPLVDLVIRRASWRWGFWIWTIVIPIAACPLLITLALGQRKAKQMGVGPSRSERRPNRFFRLFNELDFLGLLLLAIGWLLVLLPLTLRDHFSTALSLYLALGGSAVLLLFLFWETKASIPILPFRVLSNRPVVYVCLIGLLDFASFTLSWTYLSAFIQVLRSWEQTRTAYFATTQNITSTLMGIVVGYAMSTTRRYKTLMVGGVIVRLIGVSMMIRYRNQYDPTFMLVLCQLLQGIGGGAVAITMQVACQICVRHSDVALVTAFELLTTEIGAAMGSAIAGLIFSGSLPGSLARHLPMLSHDEVTRIYGSLQEALKYPLGSEIRAGIIDAWVEVMRNVCVVATLILIPGLFLALAMPNATLPDHSTYQAQISAGSLPKRGRRTSRRSFTHITNGSTDQTLSQAHSVPSTVAR